MLSDDSILDLVRALAPGRDDALALIHSYFDESETDSTLCVAGYVFRTDNVRKFEASWRAMLRQNGDLPYFRMSACNSGGHHFDKMGENERIEAQRDAIKLVGKFASYGFSATVNTNDFFGAKGVCS